MIWWPDEIPTLSAANPKAVPKTGGMVTLRSIRPSDSEDVYRSCQDPEIPRFTTVPSDYPIELAISFAGERARASHTNKTELLFVIESSELTGTKFRKVLKDGSLDKNELTSNGFAGVISLHTIDIPNHRAEIGYWIASEARNRGIGTVAAEMITEYGLMTMGFRRIDGLADNSNEGSKKLLLNAGYEYEGLLKKYVTRRDGSQIDMALFAATKS